MHAVDVMKIMVVLLIPYKQDILTIKSKYISWYLWYLFLILVKPTPAAEVTTVPSKQSGNE